MCPVELSNLGPKIIKYDFLKMFLGSAATAVAGRQIEYTLISATQFLFISGKARHIDDVLLLL